MNFENPSSLITFVNEPKLTGRVWDKLLDQRRVELIPHLQQFIASHELFRGKRVKVAFATKGVSSLVSIVESPERKTVLKIPLATNYSRGESQFLKVWEENDVKVPHVIEQGILGEHEYLLMEYIDTVTLNDMFTEEEMFKNGTYREMGTTLQRMHKPQAVGYGGVVDGVGQYQTFSEWIDSNDIQNRVRYAHDNNIFTQTDVPFEAIRALLIDHTASANKSSFCHDDFVPANIFATQPLTVFDPNPRFNNGYIDLGRSLMIQTASELAPDSREQIIEGYFEGEEHNQHALHAAIALAALMKSKYWHQTHRTKQIATINRYLKENRSLL